MQLSEEQKLQVLLIELQERYNASHKIRERSTQFTLWISGMAIALSWLLTSSKELEPSQRIGLTLLIITLSAGSLYFLAGLQRGFQKNREAMLKSERALRMHDPGIFLADGPLLPSEYSQVKEKWSHHFYTLYMWLIVVVVALFILTWT